MAVEPDYAELIDPRLIRRMSRVIRMGVGAAAACLQEAGLSCPDAIVTGTAYGCLADTGLFLTRMVEQKEELLPPTAFIQSTHNTVGGQIALMLKCHGYNNTFVHRGSSFESALLDGILLLQEDDQAAIKAGDAAGKKTVLVGAADEITDQSHAILRRFGLYRRRGDDGAYPAGEGAAFFLLKGAGTGEPVPEGASARLIGLETFYKSRGEREIRDRLDRFLDKHSIRLEDIDLVLTGDRADPYTARKTLAYKDLCGEYPTASSFALWLAIEKIRHKDAGLVLIYNRYLDHHSWILVSHADA